ncbi:metallophosphoesterase family protein [Tatumella ptyseos]|uniref:metallophosphoesterase family protein n=1 Tax=Tatumella ptyseos TaxID=82987 RepID=UPI0023EFD131|nr:metallophosphoesterase family protein [Tatumella ptyseos]
MSVNTGHLLSGELNNEASSNLRHSWQCDCSRCETLRIHQELLLVHGTPESDMLYFPETGTQDRLRETSREEIIQRIGMVDAKVILCGHTHLPREVRLNHGCLIVNPGCVGLPAYADDMPHPHIIENRTPHARYAILEKTDKSWNAEFIIVEYDWLFASQAAVRHGREDWGKCILTGYC